MDLTFYQYEILSQELFTGVLRKVVANLEVISRVTSFYERWLLVKWYTFPNHHINGKDGPISFLKVFSVRGFVIRYLLEYLSNLQRAQQTPKVKNGMMSKFNPFNSIPWLLIGYVKLGMHLSSGLWLASRTTLPAYQRLHHLFISINPEKEEGSEIA